uniref:Trafficking protein particle complex subunit 13 n=1 Tax=Tetraselmis chuii TaxID=63592 RepID=A0A7S1T4R9_9CHLO|mmetsp:Transcript_512/g.872  ORF Transcript_512/g.872 Transcript_512/m.872 type:complete len:359 (+) Transcript_512:2-1078(+)
MVFDVFSCQTFCSYISVVNYSEEVVSSVVVKAEVQTERQKSVLFDNSAAPLALLTPGARYDFIVSHDVKELGAHTLVCCATYSSGEGERKYLPQYFKFPAHNPLSVRTKVRAVGEDSFLETCVENCTKSPLLINYVRFDPSPHLTVTELKRPTVVTDFKEEAEEGDVVGDYMQQLKVVQPNGGMRHFLYHLQRVSSVARGEATNSLGKLEIRWHGAMGEVGRLQTQQIMGAPTPRKEVEVKVVSLPSQVWIHKPFQAELLVRSHVERRVGPLRLVCSDTTHDSSTAGQQTRQCSVAVCGLATSRVGELSPFGSATLTLTMVALGLGVQSISGLSLVDDREGKPYDSISHTQIFVHSSS